MTDNPPSTKFAPPMAPAHPTGPIVSETCGNCQFGQMIKEDLSLRECWGVPPTPAVVGMGPQGPAIAVLRARLPSNGPGCALHRKKSQILKG